jgi:hypothetical protein
MKRLWATCGRILLLATATALSSCSGGSNSTNDYAGDLAIPPNNIVSTRVDRIGDASAAIGSPWDITQVQSTLVEGPFRNEYVSLQVSVSFAQDVSTALPPTGQPLIGHPDRLGVELLLDIDGSAGTGISERVCSSTPNVGGIDAFVDAGGYNGRNTDGSYPILNTSGLRVDDAPVTVSGHTITYSIDLAAWGVPATGIPKTKVSVIAFNGSGAGGIATDCAPDSGPMSVSGS